ncbi:MAG: hypothetical protein C4323_25595 [Mastigocladus sp. ERB_26_2]
MYPFLCGVTVVGAECGMNGMQAGFDMTTEEGIAAFQKAYNQQILKEKPNNSFLQEIGSLFTGSSLEAQFPLSSSNSSKQKPKSDTKGFESPDKRKKSKGKKR